MRRIIYTHITWVAWIVAFAAYLDGHIQQHAKRDVLWNVILKSGSTYHYEERLNLQRYTYNSHSSIGNGEPHLYITKEVNIHNDCHSKQPKRDACYAPPLIYGGVCESSSGLIGKPDTHVIYTSSPVGKTQICCRGRACNSEECFLVSIGCSGDQPVEAEVLWGAVAGTPAIQCLGVIYGSSVNWSWRRVN